MGGTSTFARVMGLTRSLRQPETPMPADAATPLDRGAFDDPVRDADGGHPGGFARPPQPRSPLPTVPVEATTEAAITSIEDDIASILATLEREDHAAAAEAENDAPHDWLPLFEDEPAAEADEEAQMGALLNELNRLWLADPDVTQH